jgi:hypothetical protein
MAKKIISFKVVRGKDIVEGVGEGLDLRELVAKLVFEESD